MERRRLLVLVVSAVMGPPFSATYSVPVDWCHDVSRDCSQPARSTTDYPFPCKIGHRKACDAFMKNSMKTDSSGPICPVAPKLTAIGIYMRPSGKNKAHYPALKFSFRFPPGKKRKTQAIRINFSSSIPSDFYNSLQMCRLFDFSDAVFGQYNNDHPRILNYSCFTGLAEEDDWFYRILLTALPYGGTGKYLIKTFKQLPTESKPNDADVWKPTVAVASFLDFTCSHSIHVVVEKPKYKNCDYQVSLYRQYSSDPVSFEKLKNSYEHEFRNLKPANYRVLVAVVNRKCKMKIAQVYSHYVLIKNEAGTYNSTNAPNNSTGFKEYTPTVDTPLSNRNYLFKVLASCAGAVVAVLLALLLFLMLMNRIHSLIDPNIRIRVLLLFQPGCQSREDLIEKLSTFFKNCFKWSVHQFGKGDFQTAHWNYKFSMVDFVIVVFSPCPADHAPPTCFQSQEQEISNLFHATLKRVLQLSEKNHLQVAVVHLDHAKVPSSVIAVTKFNLTKELHRLYWFVYNRTRDRRKGPFCENTSSPIQSYQSKLEWKMVQKTVKHIKKHEGKGGNQTFSEDDNLISHFSGNRVLNNESIYAPCISDNNNHFDEMQDNIDSKKQESFALLHLDNQLFSSCRTLYVSEII